jgi:hypothetical protein
MPYRMTQTWSSPWSIATIVKVHRHGQGAKGGPKIRPSANQRAARTTKILALTEALGNLVRFILLPGRRFDTVGIAPLINDVEFGGLIADKAFDSNWIIEDMNERKSKNRYLAASQAHQAS